VTGAAHSQHDQRLVGQTGAMYPVAYPVSPRGQRSTPNCSPMSSRLPALEACKPGLAREGEGKGERGQQADMRVECPLRTRIASTQSEPTKGGWAEAGLQDAGSRLSRPIEACSWTSVELSGGDSVMWCLRHDSPRRGICRRLAARLETSSFLEDALHVVFDGESTDFPGCCRFRGWFSQARPT